MNIARRETPRVVGWTPPRPGNPLPDPVLEDDRAEFPVEVVKAILQWMDQQAPAFCFEEPTPTLVTLQEVKPIRGLAEGVHRVSIVYGRGEGVRLEQFDFTAATLEFTLRAKDKGPISATYRYLGVRDQHGRAIIGPRLGAAQTQAIVLSIN
ncbi:MAG: hypothetical protein IPK75_18355 [Acidobacteria bacterium]|nr:hypothetical protein [Acidobacteriota bacterium]